MAFIPQIWLSLALASLLPVLSQLQGNHPVGEAHELDKCSGCASIVDQLWQGVTRNSPRKNRAEYEILEVFEELCDGFVNYEAVDAGGFLWYHRRWKGDLPPDGPVLKSFCERFLEKHEDKLVEYARNMESATNVQLDVCVEMASLCDRDRLVEMAQAVVAFQKAKVGGASSKGKKSKKKTKGKKPKKEL
jgi:hypothetical protein